MAVIQCYGQRVAVIGLSAEALSDISRFTGLPCFDSEEPPVGHFSFRKNAGGYLLEMDGSFLAESVSLKFLAEILKAQLFKKVAALNPDLLFLQADVVRTVSGETVVVVGPSITGKSRLAQTFVNRGFTLWSKDLAVFDSEGRLMTFPSAELPASGVLPTVVLMVSYEPGAELALEEPSLGQTVLHLTAAQLLPSDKQSEVFACLGQIATQAKARFFGQRGESEDAVTRLVERLGIYR